MLYKFLTYIERLKEILKSKIKNDIELFYCFIKNCNMIRQLLYFFEVLFSTSFSYLSRTWARGRTRAWGTRHIRPRTPSRSPSEFRPRSRSFRDLKNQIRGSGLLLWRRPQRRQGSSPGLKIDQLFEMIIQYFILIIKLSNSHKISSKSVDFK